MNSKLLIALTLVLVSTPIAAHAQATTTPPTRPTRDQMAERRDVMRQRQEARKAMTPEQRAAARSQARERFQAMSPEAQQFSRDQRAYSQGLRDKSRELRAQVTAGSLTRDAMAQQLKAYRDANRPARPASLPPRSKTP
jgi:hypothetical protein